MHLILVSNRMATAKTVTITPRLAVLLAFAFLGVVLSAALLFSSLGLRWQSPAVDRSVSDPALASLPPTSHSDASDFVRGSLDAMAARLGEMQAKLLRLDSLSERISRLSGVSASDANGSPRHKAGSRGGQGGPLVIDLSSPSEAELRHALERLEVRLEQSSDRLTALQSQLLDQRSKNSLLPTQQPIDGGRIGSGFGSRRDPIAGVRARHEGIDFIADPGTRVNASAGGVVLTAEFHPEYGNIIEIDHGNELSSRYAHLARIDVKPGQLVRPGEQIGVSGNTGRSTGPHLHFEVRSSGVAVNPQRFLRQHAGLAQDTGAGGGPRLR